MGSSKEIMNGASVFGAPHYAGAVLYKDEGKVQTSGGKEEVHAH